MPALCCTKKLLVEVGASRAPALARHEDDWHANLIRIGSRKFVIFCSTNTLYTCLTPPCTRAQLRSLHAVFMDALAATLLADGFSRTSIDHCLESHRDMAIGKTNDRSVLGTMTENVLTFRYFMDREGGPDACAPTELAARLNDMPQVKRDFFNARTAFQRRFIRGVP